MGTNAHHPVNPVSPKRPKNVARSARVKLPASAGRGGSGRVARPEGQALEKELEDYQKTERLIHHAYDESQKLIMDLLHEDIGQRFTGIALQAGVLHKSLLKEAHALAQQAHEVAASIGECIALVRDLARGVYPTSLHSGGLGPALESLTERIHSRFKIPCKIIRKHAAVFSPSHSLQIYRLVEIALLAAVKNHKAESISVTYGTIPRPQVRISYLDRKASAKTTAKSQEELQLLRSRARLIGATVRIRSGKNRTVTILLPA